MIPGVGLAGRCRMRRECAELSEKRCRPSAIGKRGQGAKRVFLTDRQAGTDSVGVYADALELVEQIREPFRL